MSKAGFGDGYSLGLNMVVSAIIGAAAGYALDKWLGTLPLFFLLLLFLGFAAGLYKIWQTLNRKQPAESAKTGADE